MIISYEQLYELRKVAASVSILALALHGFIDDTAPDADTLESLFFDADATAARLLSLYCQIQDAACGDGNEGGIKS